MKKTLLGLVAAFAFLSFGGAARAHEGEDKPAAEGKTAKHRSKKKKDKAAEAPAGDKMDKMSDEDMKNMKK